MKKLAANVLLIDDEEQFLKVLGERLETRGLKVNTVTSGEDALTLIDDENYVVGPMPGAFDLQHPIKSL